MLSARAISAVGIVYADAPPVSERPSPAAPSAVTAAAWVVCACFAACFTLGIVTSFRKALGKGQLDVASELIRLEMRPGASGSLRATLFCYYCREKLDLAAALSKSVASKTPHESHLCPGQRKLVPLRQRPTACWW